MLKAEILGQLILMQNVLINLPDEKSIFSFVCQGFSDIPGVEHVYYSEAKTDYSDNSILPFRLEKNNNYYGELVLKISDYSKFSDYKQFIRNFVFMVEVRMEC